MSEQSKKMKAIYYEDFGAPEQVLKFGDLPLPVIKPSQVLIKAKAASLNPVDWKTTVGYVKQLFPVELPYVPGHDVAGVIAEVGAEVKDFKAGDEVYANIFRGNGTFSEFVVAEAVQVAKKPSNLSFVEAASLPLVVQTSNQVLQKLKAKKGDKLLVIGGGSACGVYAIQLGVLAGVHVAATCSTTNVDRLKQYGAEVVIDYTKNKWFDDLKGQDYDFVYDTVGEVGSYENAAKILKKGGSFVEITGRGPSTSPDHPRLGHLVTTTPDGGRELAQIASLFEQGKLKTIVEKVADFRKLDAVVELFKISQSGKAKGKLVVTFD